MNYEKLSPEEFADRLISIENPLVSVLSREAITPPQPRLAPMSAQSVRIYVPDEHLTSRI